MFHPIPQSSRITAAVFEQTIPRAGHGPIPFRVPDRACDCGELFAELVIASLGNKFFSRAPVFVSRRRVADQKILLKPTVSYAASPSDTASRPGVHSPVQERF